MVIGSKLREILAINRWMLKKIITVNEANRPANKPGLWFAIVTQIKEIAATITAGKIAPFQSWVSLFC